MPPRVARRGLNFRLLLALLAAAPACSSTDKQARQAARPLPGSSGRVSLRPPGYPRLNSPRPLYISGYAGTNYGPAQAAALPVVTDPPTPPRRGFGLFRNDP